MADHDKVTNPTEIVGQRFGDKNRAVLAARTTDGYRQVAAFTCFESPQPGFQKLAQIGDHLHHLRLAFQKLDNRPIQPGQRSQLRLPVWVRQAANVKDEISVRWYPVFKTEGLEQQ